MECPVAIEISITLKLDGNIKQDYVSKLRHLKHVAYF